MGLVMGPDNITSAGCHCRNTLRFSVCYESCFAADDLCVCVVMTMMITNTYCLHIVVPDDSSGCICIFLIFNLQLYSLFFFFFFQHILMEYLNFLLTVCGFVCVTMCPLGPRAVWRLEF